MYNDNPYSDANDSVHDPRAVLMPQSSSGNIPSWLQDSTSQSINNSNSAQTSSEPAPQNPEIPRIIFLTRMANISLSTVMILVSILSLISTNSATTGVLACYVTVFSCLLCCFEAHFTQVSKFIALNFGFMYSAKSRAAFMIFLGTILFSFSLFGKLVGLIMIGNAGFNIYVLFKYPGFDEAQRSSATQDIQQYLASNPAFAQQFISLGVQNTAAYAAENPNVAKSVISSYFGFSPPPTAPPSSQPQQYASV